ncbi:hypothetical protein, unknown function [Leishmania braziliensis MHOM/BR/75/M2904]|uniref:Uncharacterized protein n=2 Tax=Leishmania braziliensis TaxID=5660 RepID=A4HCY5_LEIBR|nr:hypothetical protein, unknown function [Leishmania braziliensis MHOM/BR/75/M2904]CAJ2473284.1 unnamed protein product [Leishmania braziliensis]CAM36631.1 hypothetical protein, unknown function [Leishmania braziliensis MHOM/BR/75/M2904]
MSTTTAQTELASVCKNIQSALSKIQETSAKRHDQEQRLISSVASAKCLAGIFSVYPPTNDEVVQVLKSSGEEEQVEVECLQRYRQFVEAKRDCFTAVEADMCTVSKEITNIFGANEKTEVPTNGDYRLGVEENQCEAELLHLFRLWRTVVCLHDLVLAPLLKRGLDVPRYELQCTNADEERSYARELALRNAVADTQAMLFEVQKRLRDLTMEAEALRITAESTTLLRFQDSATVLISDERDEALAASIRQGLHELQQSSERLRRKKVAVDEDAASLMEKVRNLNSQIAICNCSIEAFSQNSREAADDANGLVRAKTDALRTLHRKAQEYAAEQELLERDIGNYEQLCSLLMERAANDDSKVKLTVAAEQAYHSLLSEEKIQQEKLTRVQLSIESLESEVRDASTERQRILGEVQYLSKLVSNATVVKRVLARAGEECDPVRKVTVIDDYLRFVQKARLERHGFYE